MPGTRKRTKGGSPVQQELAGMAESEVELEAQEARVPGNCRLPLEICQHIFKKLDSEEKITFSRTLIPWHELVTKERPVILCPKVAPVLIEYLPRKALLQCRQLTRSWTQALDQQNQNHPDHVSLPFEIASGTKQIPKLINRFRSADTIQRFLEDMRENPGNPFPASNVHLIWLGPARLETEFWNNALQLLQLFGKHVYYVQLIGFRLVPCFRNCLAKLPNLRGLSIRESYDSYDFPLRTTFSLPRLRNLEMLEIQFASQSSLEFVLNLCPIPKNMKRLSIDASAVSKIPEVVYSYINLEVLDTRLDILDLKRFSKLGRPPPLRSVQLQFNKPVAAHQVFRALEPFANTLIHLKGWHMTSYDHLAWINTDINLLNLTKLTLLGFNLSLDPFIKLTSLTDLTVDSHDSCNCVEGSHVEFFGYKKPMKDSNIWKLIPTLNRLTVSNTIHYRPLPPKPSRRSKRKCVLNAKKYF